MNGVIEQVPSSVSAIKVDGKRAYQRVRDGEKVELKARKVEIFRMEILQVRSDEIDLDITCSAGTYIRSIARDVGGHLISLRRIEASPFTLADACEISVESIISSASAISKVLPLLKEQCFRCHAEKVKGGLKLDSREELLKAGDSGKVAVVPGSPEKSYLIEKIRGKSTERMPPNGLRGDARQQRVPRTRR